MGPNMQSNIGLHAPKPLDFMEMPIERDSSNRLGADRHTIMCRLALMPLSPNLLSICKSPLHRLPHPQLHPPPRFPICQHIKLMLSMISSIVSKLYRQIYTNVQSVMKAFMAFGCETQNATDALERYVLKAKHEYTHKQAHE